MATYRSKRNPQKLVESTETFPLDAEPVGTTGRIQQVLPDNETVADSLLPQKRPFVRHEADLGPPGHGVVKADTGTCRRHVDGSPGDLAHRG